MMNFNSVDLYPKMMLQYIFMACFAMLLSWYIFHLDVMQVISFVILLIIHLLLAFLISTYQDLFLL